MATGTTSLLRSLSTRSLFSASLRRADIRAISSTSAAGSNQPNAPVELDPSFQALLKDVDLSILRHKARQLPGADAQAHRELEVFPHDPLRADDYMTSEELDSQEYDEDSKDFRKSPAARFGSQRVGAVILPLELQQTITRLISASDKPTLHEDAKRLFLDNTGEEPQWDSSYDVKYKSRIQAVRHNERDGTAFASVALPSHYAAIFAVLDHLKQRIGPDSRVEHIIDWGSGTGSGLWAASHVFQEPLTPDGAAETIDIQISKSTISTYLGIDKRDGLVKIARRLIQGVDIGSLSASWQKSFHDDNKIRRSDGTGVLALSAFILSSLPTSIARKTLVKEMWESGAEIMVLIDHNTTAGFENIAEARETLLRMGKKESQDPETVDWPIRGSHVVAPCPHDHACPIHRSGSNRVVCGFSQRLQRPDFVRKTKHSGLGHEDTGYSYVIIRRGSRPPPIQRNAGRIGSVGQRELEKEAQQAIPIVELVVDERSRTASPADVAAATTPAEDLIEPNSELDNSSEKLPTQDLESILRSEAYYWPRLVFPPLKKSGHIILDGCTAEGKIMRMTIPKSQGKQPFYDARKSNWGDIFPHDPKNPAQVRYEPKQLLKPTSKDHDADKGSKSEQKVKHSYAKVAADLKQETRRIRKERKRLHGSETDEYL
ncbi:hypothetical protein PHLCEN_2v2868 [Hermanssonia centrifuga]|uniref:Rsm22-domain-containing protein n=1 Tax=Hermanssonia centrifuga TaxID=98765 RepID=A0A2R6RI62_9APHY|nr:hypothetical protein PHLCEN_2v2868 [Hermanssonia centrifuga]